MLLIRARWIRIERELRRYIDLRDIKSFALTFYNLQSKFMSTTNFNEKMLYTFQMRVSLDNCRIAIRTLLEPEEDSYIAKYSTYFESLNESIGRFDRRLDKYEEEFSKVDNIRMYADRIGKQVGLLKLERYVGELNEGIISLALYPLERSFKKFMAFHYQKDGKIAIKDVDLLKYFIFIQIYHSYQTMGAWTREDKRSTQTEIIEKGQSSHPPDVPTNIKTEELLNPLLINNSNNLPENYFKKEESLQ